MELARKLHCRSGRSGFPDMEPIVGHRAVPSAVICGAIPVLKG
jgi:hypothetical protein